MAGLSLVLLLGTLREGRESEKVANHIKAKIASDYPDVTLSFFDVRNFNMPTNDDGTRLAAFNPEYQQAMAAADGLIMVVPEYNRSFPGSFKRALDMLYNEYSHKAGALVAVSSGPFGGVRLAEIALPTFRTIGLTMSRFDLYVSNVEKAVTDEGFVDPYFDGSFKKFMDELIWVAEALKAKRG